VLGTLMIDDDGGGFSRHANFETAFRAISSLVRMSTGDSWSAMLADAVHNPHAPGIEPPPRAIIYIFFVFYMSFMGGVLVSIFVAIILDYFNECNSEEGISVKYDDIENFQRKWLEFDVRSSSYIRTVDLGLLLYACKPPLVGVQLQARDGLFFEGSRLVRPNLAQLDQLLVELDVPDHDGSVHFLEVLLALLQRLTGIINEEEIMARLLHLHPKYVTSIKRMPSITGSTADAYVKDEIMTHLRRGLQATGLLEEDKERGKIGGRSSCASSLSRSFTRRCSISSGADVAAVTAAAEDAKQQRQRDVRRAGLARCSTTNNLGVKAAAALGGNPSIHDVAAQNARVSATHSVLARAAGLSPDNFNSCSPSPSFNGRSSSFGRGDPLAC